MRRVAVASSSSLAVRSVPASGMVCGSGSGSKRGSLAVIQVAPRTATVMAAMRAPATSSLVPATTTPARARALVARRGFSSAAAATRPATNPHNHVAAVVTNATSASDNGSGTSAAFAELTLDEIMNQKRTKLGALTSVSEDDTVFSAIGTMEKQGIGAVLVKNGDGQYTGIFSERDYMRKIALQGLSSRTTSVKKVMTVHPVIVPSSTTAIQAMELMTERRFRHIPVRHDATNEVVGIVSIGDIMRVVLKEYKDSATYLHEMVSGKYV